jgi:hypothetical protein
MCRGASMSLESRQIMLRRREAHGRILGLEPATSNAQQIRWWRRARTRTIAAGGAILLSFVTGVVVKYGDSITGPALHRATGQPIFVTAIELPEEAGMEPIVRMLPAGVTDHDRTLMTDQAGGLERQVDLGVPVGRVKLRLVVQAKDASVLLTGLRLVVDERQPPLANTLLFVGTQGAGKPIQVMFDADTPAANTPRGTPAMNLQGHDYFDGDNYELDPGQSVEFRAFVTTHHCYCRWHLEVDATLDGRTRSVQVRRPDGSEFEVSSATDKVHEVYEYSPLEPPKTTLGSIGPWTRVPPPEFCKPGSVCDPLAWPWR